MQVIEQEVPVASARKAAASQLRPLTLRLLGITLRILLIVTPTFIAAIIAHNAIKVAHADEDAHFDAFHWFQDNWTRPEVGQAGLMYSTMGWSRVYTGEIVYCVYGRLNSVLRPDYPRLAEAVGPAFRSSAHQVFVGFEAMVGRLGDTDGASQLMEPQDTEPDADYLYRYFNVALLFLTLLAIVFTRCRWFNPLYLGLTLIGIPQVVYLYSYANSDAWGLTWSLLLFVQTANLLDHPPRTWRWYRIGMWMFSALMLLLSKQGFVLGLALPVVLLFAHFIRLRHDSPSAIWFAIRWVLPAFAVWILTALWNPNYSIHRAQWKANVEQMREEMALEQAKPSNPTGHYYMAAQGITYDEMMHMNNGIWLRRILQSFYGQFGAWTVHHSQTSYDIAAILALCGLLLTIIAQFLFWPRMNPYLAISILLAPILIAINFYGAMWYSLNVDFQPQGRYLFACLVGVFFLFAGTISIERRWYRWLHTMLFVPMISLSMYVLLYYGAWEPLLQQVEYWRGLR